MVRLNKVGFGSQSGCSKQKMEGKVHNKSTGVTVMQQAGIAGDHNSYTILD